MREDQVKFFCIMLLDGLEALKWPDEAWRFARREGLDIDYERSNIEDVKKMIIDFLAEHTKILMLGEVP